MPASASAATSCGRVVGSSFTQARAEVSRYSAIPPSLPSRPGEACSSLQCMSCPARQARHSPQVGVGCRITVSPTATLVTAEPTSCTQPAFSWPIVYGSVGFIAASHWPWMMCRSVRHTPAPPIFTTTSSGPVDRRLRDLLDDGLLVVPVQPDGLHRPLLHSRPGRGCA